MVEEGVGRCGGSDSNGGCYLVAATVEGVGRWQRRVCQVMMAVVEANIGIGVGGCLTVVVATATIEVA